MLLKIIKAILRFIFKGINWRKTLLLTIIRFILRKIFR